MESRFCLCNVLDLALDRLLIGNLTTINCNNLKLIEHNQVANNWDCIRLIKMVLGGEGIKPMSVIIYIPFIFAGR